MQKFGFVFPGQGSQKLGMLATLAERSPVIKATFAEASEVLGQDLWEIAQLDGQNTLDQTDITQPALLAASVAIWRLWESLSQLRPSILIGHSLGEYSALVCASAINFQDAVNIVHLRGQFMQSAAPAGKGKMAAIVGLDRYVPGLRPGLAPIEHGVDRRARCRRRAIECECTAAAKAGKGLAVVN